MSRLEETIEPLNRGRSTGMALLDAEGGALERRRFGPDNAETTDGEAVAVVVPVAVGAMTGDLGWRISVAQSARSIEAPTRDLTAKIVALAAGISVVVSAVIILAGAWVQRRLAAAQGWVKTFTRHVSGGAYVLRPTPEGRWVGTVHATHGASLTGHCPGETFDHDRIPGLSEEHHTAMRAAAEAALHDAGTGRPHPMDVTVCQIHAARAPRWFRCTYQGRRDPDRGAIVEMATIDITALKRTEEGNRQLADERAEAADRLARRRSEILAVMAHEIRTPLTGVIGFGELLANAGLPAEQHAHAQTVVESGRFC